MLKLIFMRESEALHHKDFFFFFGAEGVPWTVCQIFIRDIAKHFSFIPLSSQDKQFSGSKVLEKKKKKSFSQYHDNTIASRHVII